jgi:hypothetical protein
MLLVITECAGGYSGESSDINMQFACSAQVFMHYSGLDQSGNASCLPIPKNSIREKYARFRRKNILSLDDTL